VDKLSNHESNVPDNRNHRTKKRKKKGKEIKWKMTRGIIHWRIYTFDQTV
jgi:hypothetical protein